MTIIIPMAGLGKRMRPHTITTAKPLIPVAGFPMVELLVEEISKTLKQKIDTIAFVIGDFGTETEKKLIKSAEHLGAKGKIYYQKQPMGTAHAVLCTAEILEGPVIIAFADTLFKADFKINFSDESVIWVNKVKNPENFGVVKINNEGIITEFIEKPKTFVSDLAIIGIYYFSNGKQLRNELQYLIDNNILVKGEYQLTDALQNMKQKGVIFKTADVAEWLDCGNKQATLFTNERMLFHRKTFIDKSVELDNVKIIEPVFIAKNCKILRSTIGPFTAISENTEINESTISKSIIRENAEIRFSNIKNSIVGQYTKISKVNGELSLGDYSELSYEN